MQWISFLPKKKEKTLFIICKEYDFVGPGGFCWKSYDTNYRPFPTPFLTLSAYQDFPSPKNFYDHSCVVLFDEHWNMYLKYFHPGSIFQASLIIASSSPWSVWFDYCAPAASLCSSPQGSDPRVRGHPQLRGGPCLGQYIIMDTKFVLQNCITKFVLQIHSFPGGKVACIHVRGYIQLTGGQGFWSMPLSMY